MIRTLIVVTLSDMGFERAPSFGRAGSGVSAATAKLLHHSKRGVDSMPSEWPQNERDFEALAKAGEINYADDDGMTPLHFAARWGGDVATQILVDAKADINAKNKVLCSCCRSLSRHQLPPARELGCSLRRRCRLHRKLTFRSSKCLQQDGKTPLQLVQERCSELGRCPELAKLNRVIAILDPPTLPSARGRGGTATSPLKRTAVKYVMVAYRRNDTELLSSSERQELLLIRANIAPPEPKGGKECKVTQEMKDEIKEMLNEPHLYDEHGMLLRASEAKGETIAQVRPVLFPFSLSSSFPSIEPCCSSCGVCSFVARVSASTTGTSIWTAWRSRARSKPCLKSLQI